MEIVVVCPEQMEAGTAPIGPNIACTGAIITLIAAVCVQQPI